MSDPLARLFEVAAGGGDPAAREELLRPESDAHRLAEEVGRLNAREIDPRRVPGLEGVVECDDRPPTPCSCAADRVAEHQPAAGPSSVRADHPPRARAAGLGRKLAVAGLALFVAGAFAGLAASLRAERAAHAQAREELDQTNARLREVSRDRMADSLDGGWLDPTRWKTGRRMTTAVDGYARLNDRGSLVTVGEFPAPVEVELEWRWIDIAGDIAYRDTLTVALHSSGEHAPTHPFEIRDGVAVTFQAHSGQVSLSPRGDAQFGGTTPEGALPMPSKKWHKIRLIDDGRTIVVYFSGPAIDRSRGDTPALTAPYVGKFSRHHVAIYNREPVAGAFHESHVRNVSVGPQAAGSVAEGPSGR